MMVPSKKKTALIQQILTFSSMIQSHGYLFNRTASELEEYEEAKLTEFLSELRFIYHASNFIDKLTVQ